MADNAPEDYPIPVNLRLHRRSRVLEIDYPGGEAHKLDCEYLRISSPSAEVRGHGSGNEILQTGKRQVSITAIEPVGNYGVKLVFDDGHDTGIYSWAFLYDLCVNRERYWNRYMQLMEEAGASRDP